MAEAEILDFCVLYFFLLTLETVTRKNENSQPCQLTNLDTLTFNLSTLAMTASVQEATLS
jgi:hypothetical protein